MTPTNIKNENYTPYSFMRPCFEFMGWIDLDPFSCLEANEYVNAYNFFTEETDGLSQNWSEYRRKWVNPPYSGGLITPSIDKTLQYTHIGETLLLVNSSTSAKWYQDCLEHCSAVLFPSKRIQFWNPYEERKSSNRYDQTLFYFGDRRFEFADQLGKLGTPVMPVPEKRVFLSFFPERSLVS
jgi:hypothetical protein